MILFKQYPLNGLNTFEDELLFLLAGNVEMILGCVKDGSIMNRDGIENTYLLFTKDSHIEKNLGNALGKLLKKYNKSFTGNFVMRLIKQDNGRWRINIKENMSEIPKELEELRKHVR
jgi:hypothetical protein